MTAAVLPQRGRSALDRGSILDIPVPEIKNLTVLNGEMPPELQNGKLCRLELLLNVNDSVMNIELHFGRAISRIRRILRSAILRTAPR